MEDIARNVSKSRLDKNELRKRELWEPELFYYSKKYSRFEEEIEKEIFVEVDFVLSLKLIKYLGMLGIAYSKNGKIQKAQNLIENHLDKMQFKFGHNLKIVKDIKYQKACIYAALNRTKEAIRLLKAIGFPMNYLGRTQLVDAILYEKLKHEKEFQLLYLETGISMPLMEPI